MLSEIDLTWRVDLPDAIIMVSVTDDLFFTSSDIMFSALYSSSKRLISLSNITYKDRFFQCTHNFPLRQNF